VRKQLRKHLIVVSSFVILTGGLLGTLVLGNHSFAHPHAAAAHAAVGSASSTSRGSISLQALHALFFVWASGTPAVEQAAAQDCIQLHLTASQCQSVSHAVRTAWLDLADRDPVAVGRPNAVPNLTGRGQALDALGTQLATITNGHVAALLSATAATNAQISQPQWIQEHVANAQALPAGTVLVWATSYTQRSLPNGLNAKRSPYAALPDAYLKFANWGLLSNIPSIYQPYYAPTGGTAHWSVNVANASGSGSVANVLIADVGPWNEDDNWWDTNGTSTTLPANCPVSAMRVAPDATSNALVNGICPNGANLRRIYYYLLYQHVGLPFFGSAGYAPSGNFADGTAWPIALAQYCSEAAAGSKNNDGITCYSGTTRYNNTNGGWLRNNTYDAGITNQSSIDLSPAIDKALGWVYPSSGLVQVTVGGLP
jgi:hypothetical protein